MPKSLKKNLCRVSKFNTKANPLITENSNKRILTDLPTLYIFVKTTMHKEASVAKGSPSHKASVTKGEKTK
ncbi:hypothetical protein [Aequorivita antarctica]|uniref:Uncharacterized protein n=1 Tax=Aequorivita antarctica TaxID=153266 RepID=A0A5C6Z1H9_9FLAO|nr:hypothetical protein [Aequorivita antarctica]TXD73330.1 hypothetical protein ESU54_09360 [Aequorivita antarctica]